MKTSTPTSHARRRLRTVGSRRLRHRLCSQEVEMYPQPANLQGAPSHRAQRTSWKGISARASSSVARWCSKLLSLTQARTAPVRQEGLPATDGDPATWSNSSPCPSRSWVAKPSAPTTAWHCPATTATSAQPNAPGPFSLAPLRGIGGHGARPPRHGQDKRCPWLEAQAMQSLSYTGWRPDYVAIRRQADLQAPQVGDAKWCWLQ